MAEEILPEIVSLLSLDRLFFKQDFSAKIVVKGVCVCGVAPETTPKAEKPR